MALIKCSECGGQVSDKAAACPHCGCPATEFTSSQGKKVPKELRCPVCQYVFELGEKQCPVCRCALPESLDECKNYSCKINGRLCFLKSAIEQIEKGNFSGASITIVREAGISLSAADKLIEIIRQSGELPLEFDPAQYGIQSNLPKCPTCGSTNIERINAFDRGVAGGLFGFASKTARSQFRCKKCGYMW